MNTSVVSCTCVAERASRASSHCRAGGENVRRNSASHATFWSVIQGPASKQEFCGDLFWLERAFFGSESDKKCFLAKRRFFYIQEVAGIPRYRPNPTPRQRPRFLPPLGLR